jgi:tetratricopeptide (TPR) repeat protein
MVVCIQPLHAADLRRAQAAEACYNLDYAQALDFLRQAAAAAPDDPANHSAIASTLWQEILFRRGAVTVDHYLGGFSHATVDVSTVPPDLAAEFRREVARAIELSERRVAAAPNDPQAHLDLATAVSLQASYTASVEGKLLAGFRAARRSYDQAEQVLTLAPSRTDAGLIVGTYRYIVSTLSLPMRMMAYVAGFGGGRDIGLKMVEGAAAAGGENATDAKFALVLLYNREARYDAALNVLADLRRRYPRNRLVVLEAGATAVRAGRGPLADTLLSEGLAMLDRDTRARIPGESALWHYKRGAARVEARDEAGAGTDLALALGSDAAPWVRGRAHVELARLAARRGDRAGISREIAAATSACTAGNDPICVEDARKVEHGG